MKSIFSGYYGAKNSGDDAFVEVAAWGSEKYWHSSERLFFSEELPQIKTPSEHYSAHKNYINFASAIKDIFCSDVFVNAGGSTFHSALKNSDLRSYAKLKKILRLKGKIGAIGISLGPYTSAAAERSTIEYLKILDFLALRDTKSYDLACSYPLDYKPIKAFDLAALLPEIYGNFSVRKTFPVVGISICNYESYTGGDLEAEKERNRFIRDIIIELSENPEIRFRFFIFNGNPALGDEKITFDLIKQVNTAGNLNYEVKPYQPDVQKTFESIAECDVVLSVRLHASIFACYSKTPFFLLEYHRKCSDFLDDIGQDVRYRINEGETSVTSVVNEVRTILFDQFYVRPTNITETIERARLNFTSTY